MALVVKDPPANVGDIRDAGSIPGSRRSPGRGHGSPLSSCLENPHEQSSLVGYGPWGHKELDTTKQLTHTHKGSKSRSTKEKMSAGLTPVREVWWQVGMVSRTSDFSAALKTSQPGPWAAPEQRRPPLTGVAGF